MTTTEDLSVRGRVVMGYPSSTGLSRIFVEPVGGQRVQVGSVREGPGPRWFAQDLAGFPIEGTFKTKRAAAHAVYVAQENER